MLTGGHLAGTWLKIFSSGNQGSMPTMIILLSRMETG